MQTVLSLEGEKRLEGTRYSFDGYTERVNGVGEVEKTVYEFMGCV